MLVLLISFLSEVRGAWTRLMHMVSCRLDGAQLLHLEKEVDVRITLVSLTDR